LIVNLQCLPEDGLPKSHFSRSIWNCLLIKPHCQNLEDEDGKKISHIEELTLGHNDEVEVLN